MILAFAVGVQLSRGLGPSGYGTYAFALSVVTLVGIPTEFGLPQVVVREASAASATNDWPRFKGVGLFATGAVALSSVLVVLVAEGILSITTRDVDPTRRAAIEFGLLLIPLVGQTKLCGSLLMGLGRIVQGQLANLVLRPGLFAAFVALFALAFHGTMSPPAVMALQVGGTALSLFTSIALLLRVCPADAKSAKPRYALRLWLFAALPMALTDGMRVLQGHMSVFMIGALSGANEVGLFRVADSTAAIISFPATMLNIVAMPLFARLWTNQDIINLQKLASAVTAGTFLAVLLISAPIWIDGRHLLTLLFGPAFAPAYDTLLIGMAASIVFAVFGPCSTLMNMAGGERSVARAFGVSVATNFVVGAALIPMLGSRGAALGSLSGTLVWNVVLWAEARKKLGIDTSLLSAPRLFQISSIKALLKR